MKRPERITEYVQEVPKRITRESKVPIELGLSVPAWQLFQDTLHILPSMSFERPLTSTQQSTPIPKTSEWKKRVINRITLEKKSIPGVIVDFSKVKNVDGETTFEVEVELLFQDDYYRNKSPEEIATMLLEHLFTPIIAALQLAPHSSCIWLGPEWKQHIGDIRVCFDQMAIPQVAAFSRHHHRGFRNGEYAVSEKSDGKRMLLWITTDGQWVLIDNHFRWRVLSVSQRGNADQIRTCCIDGE